MSDTENQMGLFELEASDAPPQPPAPVVPAAPTKTRQAQPPHPVKPPSSPASPPAKKSKGAPVKARPGKGAPKAPAKGVSGLVPEGDVRLTANIRQDLHLKLKLASAYRRTTIGEIIEELVEKYI